MGEVETHKVNFGRRHLVKVEEARDRISSISNNMRSW